MKHNIFTTIAALFASLVLFSSCEDNLHIVFTDYYVCIKDENGSDSSKVSSNLDDEIYSYYVNLVAPVQDEDIVVEYEVTAGDGLKEGVDYKLQGTKRSVTLAKGVYKMPIRVIFLAHQVDPSKDNTLTIKLTGCSKSSLILGYPGPSAKFSTHTITKYNQ